MKKLLAFIACLLPLAALAQTTVLGPTHITINASGGLVMPPYDNLSTNWGNSGLALIGGIPARSTICATVNPVAGVPSGPPSANVSNVQAAINACPAGQVVLAAAGAQTTVNITLSGSPNNHLTLNSGSLAVGEGITSCNNAQPGMTVVSGGGSSWTVSYGPNVGTSVTNVTCIAFVQYNKWSSETVYLNKGVTLRGSACSGTFCPSVFNNWDGALPNWSFTSEGSNTNCGVSVTSTVGFCFSNSNSMFVLGSGNGWDGVPVLTASVTPPNASLTADAAQGATQITVNSISGFSVGMVVLLDETPNLVSVNSPASGTLNTQIGASSDFLNTTMTTADNRIANPDAGLGACSSGNGTTYSWNLYCNRVNDELHLISCLGTGCPGGTSTTIGFDSPLTIAFRQSGGHNAAVYWPTCGTSTAYCAFAYGAGLENITTYRCGGTCITIQNCIYCYVSNSEGAMFVHGHVQIEWAIRSLVTGIYSHVTADAENNGTEYPWAIDAASTENRIENSITLLGGKCMVMRAAGGGNVLGYDYCDETFYQANNIGGGWMDMGCNASHYAGTHGTLFEGSYCENCDGDETHGNNTLEAWFRNYCTATRRTFTTPDGQSVNDSAGGNVPLRATGPMAFGYWDAWVANVEGTIGISTAANGWTYNNPYIGNSGGGCSSNVGTKAIHMWGWVGGEWNCADANLKQGASPQLIFNNCNYDTVNAAVADCAGGSYASSFPNSLYLTSTPSYFTSGTCTYGYPWVTANAAPYVLLNSCGGSGNPAKARFDAGTPFSQP